MGSFTTCSPTEPLHLSDGVEVMIAAKDGKTMLAAERGNPEIVSWNWPSGLPKLDSDGCVVMRRLITDIEHSAVFNQLVQPLSVYGSASRSGYAIAVFSNDHNGQR
jgi:hypothetical protein